MFTQKALYSLFYISKFAKLQPDKLKLGRDTHLENYMCQRKRMNCNEQHKPKKTTFKEKLYIEHQSLLFQLNNVRVDAAGEDPKSATST